MARKKKRAARKSTNGGVNKSAAIRDYLDKDPKAKPLEIVSALSDKGVDVTASFVSNVKSKIKKSGRRRKRRATASASSNGRSSAQTTSVTALVGAKKFAEQSGGIDEAQKALDILKKLQ